ncbi:MAG: hypothetical protein A2146_01675 [Actinobacteria bacterium RBG_16_67_10]|nr:MAG: hypothetical protein A2146_01675 [Actinobacteria bacterium RBG_16_67_10]
MLAHITRDATLRIVARSKSADPERREHGKDADARNEDESSRTQASPSTCLVMIVTGSPARVRRSPQFDPRQRPSSVE